MPNESTRRKRRAEPVICVLAACMVMCLVYLVSLSLWALSANITAAGDRQMLVSLEQGVTFAETQAPVRSGPDNSGKSEMVK
ncbi:hypothetical protein [Breoghania sp. JC706]|uniref:hypothetical protein n=1 Tax=Breoghania sp. JC706 TaxID=3117732 RepID=UPI00300922E2